MQSKRKLAVTALLLCLCLLFSSCSLVVKDAAVDAATEIVRVGDTVYTKGEVKELVSSYLNQMASYYSSNYGMSIDVNDSAMVKQAQEAVTHDLVEGAVVKAKEEEMGYLPLSEEAEAEVQETWKEAYDLIKNVFFSSTEVGDGEGQVTEEDLDAQVRAAVAQYLGYTEEGLRTSKAQELLKAEVVKDVAVTDEEIQADYDSKVESAKTTYASNLSAYGTAVNGGETVYYRPAGYRMVKQILVQFLDEDENRVNQLNTKLTSANSRVTSATTQLNNLGVTTQEDVDALVAGVTVEMDEMDFTAATLPDLLATPSDLSEDAIAKASVESLSDEAKEAVKQLAAAKALQAKYQELVNTATEQAFARIDARADEVLAKIAAGEDWNTLVEEYNDDPGMNGDSATAQNGYAVCEGFTSFDSAFTAAAMGIESVGGTSDKTRGSYGYYIIRYESEVQEGPVDLADVRDTISSALLTTKQDELFEETVHTWVDEANAKIDLNALKD